MISEQLSNKIRILSLFCIFLVVGVHAPFLQDGRLICQAADLKDYGFLCSMMSNIVQWGVPYFFIVSGFFFFYTSKGTYKGLFNNLKKRMKTLLVPYILIITITFIYHMFPYIVYHSCGVMLFVGPNSSFWANADAYLQGNIFDIIVRLFWGEGYPAYFPFIYALWFVRDLMIVCCFSPLFLLLFKGENEKLRFSLSIVFGLLLIALNITINENNLPFLLMKALLYFYIGSFLGFYKNRFLPIFEKGYSLSVLEFAGGGYFF